MKDRSDFEKLVICKKYVDYLRKNAEALYYEIGILKSEKQELEDENQRFKKIIEIEGYKKILNNLKYHQKKLIEKQSEITKYKDEIRSKDAVINQLTKENYYAANIEKIKEVLTENEQLKEQLKQTYSTKSQLRKDSYIKVLLENVRGLEKANRRLHNQVKEYRDILFTKEYQNKKPNS